MYGQIDRWLEDNRNAGGLLLRATLGVVFFLHGFLGLVIYTPAGMAQFFGAIGMPFPLVSAWLLIAVHLVGGAMLVLGLFTRLNALMHVGVMGVATVKAHLAQGFFMSGIIIDPANGVAIAGGYEYALTLTLASLALVFLGGGAWALDGKLAQLRGARHSGTRVSGPATLA